MSIVKDLLLIIPFLVMVVRYIMLYKEMIKQQEYFINTLSHDLRVSAIAQIRGLELLEKQKDKELLGEIKNSCNFSLDMINTLINTYKYKCGELVLNYETFRLNDTIFSSCKTLSNLIEEKELELCYKTDSQIYIQADKTELEKVLNILVSTAIFNAQKQSLMYVVSKKLTKKIEVMIVYQGKPLSEEESKRMFSHNPRFSTVGHGIKMHLCKKIIDFHKGEICVENCGNNLNSFKFSIPITEISKNSKTQLLPSLQLSEL